MKTRNRPIFGNRTQPLPTHLVEAALVSQRLEALVAGDTETVARINLQLQNLVR